MQSVSVEEPSAPHLVEELQVDRVRRALVRAGRVTLTVLSLLMLWCGGFLAAGTLICAARGPHAHLCGTQDACSGPSP